VPTTGPSYTVSATLERFPNATLEAGLLSQTQTVIPLVKLQPRASGYPAVYVSDRRCTVGGQLYQARLLSWSGIQQYISSHGGGADGAEFIFGNADRVMRALANDTNLRMAGVEFSLFWVDPATGTSGIKLDLWKGEVTKWKSDAGPQFTLSASDGIYELALPYPTQNLGQTCWKKFNDGQTSGGCPFGITGGGHTANTLDLTHFPSADFGSCDKGYATDNGCLAHTMDRFFGAQIIESQGVRVKDRVNDIRITSTSIKDESIVNRALPEIYTDSAMQVNALVAAIREEGEFLRGLGIVGRGPLTYGRGHTLDGQFQHGWPHPTIGLREVAGADPAAAKDFLSMGQAGMFNDLPAWRQEQDTAGNLWYKRNFAAGVAFIELLRKDEKGIQLSRPEQHELVAIVSGGLQGWVWTGAGSRSQQTLTNPVWIAVNAFLRAKGMQFASAATAEQYFDVAAAVAAAAIADDTVDKLVGSGTETQFKFRGYIAEQKPLRSWLQEILTPSLGYYSFAFGKLRLGIRSNSSVAEAFTEGNIVWNSLDLNLPQPAFNHLTVSYSNEEKGETQPGAQDGFQEDAATFYGEDNALLISGGLEPIYHHNEMHLLGCYRKSHAHRFLITRLREELGGADLTEQLAAREVQFKTTVLGVGVEPGMVCSMTHPDMPGGAGEFRVTGWRLNPDYSIDITGRTTTDSMYDYVIAPKPEDVLPDKVPVEIDTKTRPLPWCPAMAHGFSSSAARMIPPAEYTFGIAQTEQRAAEGTSVVQVMVGGALPVNQISTLIRRPRASIVATTASTGGFLAGGKRYYLRAVAIDDITGGVIAGRHTLGSDIATVDVPAGTNTNTVTLAGLNWDPTTPGWILLFGESPDVLTYQTGAQYLGTLGTAVTVTGTSARPDTITFLGIDFPAGFPSGYFERYTGGPDQWVRKIAVRLKRLIHAGIWGGEVVSTTSTSITLAVDPPFTTNVLAGRYVSVIGMRDTGLELDEDGESMPIADFLIDSNDGDTLTLAVGQIDPGSTFPPIGLGTVVVIRAKATAVGVDATGHYLEDSASGEGGQGLGEGGDDSLKGLVVRGISGTGKGERRLIIGNLIASNRIYLEGDDNPFDTTSIFIVHESFHVLESITEEFAVVFPGSFMFMRINAANLAGEQWLVEAYTISMGGAEPIELSDNPYREIYLYGTQVEDDEPLSYLARDPANNHLSVVQPGGNLVDLETGGVGGALQFTSFDVPFSTTIEFELDDGNDFEVVLTGNVESSSIVKSSGAITDGETISLQIKQDGTGGWLFNWPPTIRGLGTQPIGLDPGAVTGVLLKWRGGEWRPIHQPVVL